MIYNCFVPKPDLKLEKVKEGKGFEKTNKNNKAK